MTLIRFSFWCFLTLLPVGLAAQVHGSRMTQESVRGFVQAFYDWYVPKALSDGTGPAWNLAIKSKASLFDPQLARALKEDLEAQSRAEGEIVGLDFDPFLDTQDPAGHYKLGKITLKGGSYWVDVHRVSSGKMSVQPCVVAQVVQKEGRWYFVDFHYSSGRDLLVILKELKESREKPSPFS